MDRASSFTSAAVALKTGFVSAGSHLQVLKEQSVNVGPTDIEEVERPSKKSTENKKTRALEGQGTLFNFLGKPEPQKNPAPVPKDSDLSKPRQGAVRASSLAQPRPTSIHTPTLIDPSLSTHRLGPPTTSTKPRPRPHHPPQARNDYVFLSSSPPRPTHLAAEEDTVEKPAALSRPPTSLHETSMSKLQGAKGSGNGGGMKTLGVRRSMNGWAGRNGGGGFVPPTMKRMS